MNPPNKIAFPLTQNYLMLGSGIQRLIEIFRSTTKEALLEFPEIVPQWQEMLLPPVPEFEITINHIGDIGQLHITVLPKHNDGTYDVDKSFSLVIDSESDITKCCKLTTETQEKGEINIFNINYFPT